MTIKIDDQTVSEIKNLLDYLESHNKNYTNAQYYKILDLKEMINNILVEK